MDNELDFENRIVSTSYTPDDTDIDQSLRPRSIEDYVGQEKAKENLKIYIEAAKRRKESLDHVLLYGPPGLGKTTLAFIIAAEMGVNIRITSGPAIERQGDLAALLTNLNEGAFSLLTRFTVFCALSRRYCTLRWRTIRLIS